MAYPVELINFSFAPPKTKGILNGVSLKVIKGEFVALVGRNGEGKTSIIKAISGELEDNTTGIVKVGSLFGAEEISKHGEIGIVHQFVQDDLVDSLSISKNIQIRQALSNNEEVRKNAKFKNWKTKVNNIISDHLCTEDFSPSLDTLVSQLSGGQKQLLNVLMALKLDYSIEHECKLLLLDEHLTSLDVVIEKKVNELIDVLTIDNKTGKRKTTIVMATHDFNHALTTNRILVIRNGQVKKEIVPNNTSEWTREFIESEI